MNHSSTHSSLPMVCCIKHEHSSFILFSTSLKTSFSLRFTAASGFFETGPETYSRTSWSPARAQSSAPRVVSAEATPTPSLASPPSRWRNPDGSDPPSSAIPAPTAARSAVGTKSTRTGSKTVFPRFLQFPRFPRFPRFLRLPPPWPRRAGA